ncbi:MAG: GGDEF domain-containing protein [Henriciella sp.]|nr:GGDEF domain-containing protein [Henriciella sp.]
MQLELYFQLLNPLVFAMFAIGFLCVHTIRPNMAARTIAASYAMGTLAFILDIAFQSSQAIPVRVLVGALYAITAALLSAGLCLHFRQRAPWRLLAAMVLVHVVIYASLYVQGFLWWRSFAANVGCGTIFLVGLMSFPRRGLTLPEKMLFGVHAFSCFQCFTRPVMVAALTAGPLTAENHNEDLFIVTLHLAVGAFAVLTGMLLTVILVREVLEDLQSHSQTDELTGVSNRRGFDSRLTAWLSEEEHLEVGIILADLDRFKRINDTYGHNAGDDVLIAFGKVLQTYTGPGRVVARLGGEEFVLALSNVPMSEVKGIAETLRNTMAAKTFNFAGEDVSVTASFGVAQLDRKENPRNALARADDALYLAKRQGRNRTRCQADLAVHRLTKAKDTMKSSASHQKAKAKQKTSKTA